MSELHEAVSCRAAFSDEAARAAYLDGGAWFGGVSHWYVAVTCGPLERIVGAVRYRYSDAGIQFRLVLGPGGELAGREQDLLMAFLKFAERFSPVELWCVDPVEVGGKVDLLLETAGFEVHYREQRFQVDWQENSGRVRRIAKAVTAGESAGWAEAQVRSVRDMEVEQILPMILQHRLLGEMDLRRMWASPDPTILDRDASCCLVLGGEVLGVILCADAGEALRFLVLVAREEVPGARTRVMPMLVAKVLDVCEGRGYRHGFFRANLDVAQQTVNLARRMKGRVTADLCKRRLRVEACV